MFSQKFQRPLHRQLGALFMKIGALIAVEAVAGRINVVSLLRMRGLNLFHVT